MKRSITIIAILGLLTQVLIAQEDNAKEKTSYRADIIRARGLSANLTITTHDKPEVYVELDGDEEDLKKITVRQSQGKLGKQRPVLIISEDRTDPAAPALDVDIEILAPENVALDLSGHKHGDWEIGGQIGDVRLELDGRIKVDMDDINGNCKLELHGEPEVEIDSIHGSVDIRIQRRGKVKIEGGEISSLNAFISGHGSIEIDGTVSDSEISIHGDGDVEIKEAMKDMAIDISGTGDVEVDGGDLDNFSVKIAGNGEVEYEGKTKDADVTIKGSGTVKINTIEGTLLDRTGFRYGSGKVEVKNGPKIKKR